MREVEQSMQRAALDPAQWERALNAVNAFVDGSGAALITVGARQKLVPASTDAVEMIDDYFKRGWYTRDRREGCIPLLKARGLVFDHDFQTVDEIERCDFYEDFLAPHGRKWFAGVGAAIDGDDWCLSLQRSPSKGPFSLDDANKLQFVRNVLGNAAVVSQKLGNKWLAGLHGALSMMEVPAIVMDRLARVSQINDAAASVIGGFIEADGSLDFRSAASNDKFSAMLSGSSSPSRFKSFTNKKYIINIGAVSYSCSAIYLLKHEELIATSASNLVLFEPINPSIENNLKKKYGLTSAEAAVAIDIAGGKSVKLISSERNIKEDTVRKHLKSVYSKTETGRQSQLVLLINNGLL